MLVLDITVMNVALPRIQHDLHFSSTGLSWVMNVYTLAFGGLLLLGGRLGDLFGRRTMLIAGISLFTVASLAGGFAESAAWLLISRAAQGVGGAMAGPSVLALITTTFTEQKARLRALALFSGMSSAGFSIGLILGGVLTESLSWRWSMFINVPFGIAVVILASRLLPPAGPRKSVHLDVPGAITATSGIATLVYGFISAAERGWDAGVTLGSLSVGAVLLAAFVAVESRTAEPLLPLRLFADRNRAAAYAAMALGPMAGMSTFFFLTQYLQQVRGMNALSTGFAFLPLGLCVFAMTRLIPRVLPRFGPKYVASLGFGLMSVGLALLVWLDVDTGYFPLIFAAMSVLGLGLGMAISPLSVVIMGSVPAADAGSAGGSLQTMQQVGSALGLAVMVTVFDSATRHAAGAPRHVLVTGMTEAFGLGACIAALACAVAFTFRR
ncbi:MAG: MFS transporter [Mycobacteriaceae bacterium]|nr:MFS transporter [Mycobacteriaceae bacterium]